MIHLFPTCQAEKHIILVYAFQRNFFLYKKSSPISN